MYILRLYTLNVQELFNYILLLMFSLVINSSDCISDHSRPKTSRGVLEARGPLISQGSGIGGLCKLVLRSATQI